MNNQERFTTRSSKLKVYRVNSQTISSHPVRFFTDILKDNDTIDMSTIIKKL